MSYQSSWLAWPVILALTACASPEVSKGAAPAGLVSERVAPVRAESVVPPAPVVKAEAPAAVNPVEPVTPERAENSVFFAFASARVDLQGDQLLRQHAERLKADPDVRVTLVAYTDNLGSRSYNLAIAEERMNSVVSRLRSFGVPAKQIQRKSAGQSSINTSCNTIVCRQQMRRVELMYK